MGPGGPMSPPPPPPGGPLMGGPTGGPDSPAGTGLDPAAWQAWWRFNGDAWLDLARILDGLDTRSGGDGFTLGSGERRSRRAALDERTVQGVVVPALLETLRAGNKNELVRAMLVSLARAEASWGDAKGTTSAFLADWFLGTEHQDAAEAAVVALGVRGDPAAAANLIDLLLDTPAGRGLRKSDAVDWRIRALAAYSLGLIGRGNDDEALRRRIAGALIENLELNATAPFDIQLASLVALGMVPMGPCDEPEGVASEKPPSEHFCRGRELALLLDYLVDPRRHSRLRAHAAVPLARLAADAKPEHRALVIEWLLGAVGPRSKEAPEVQEGAVLALGLLGDADDDELDGAIRSALERQAARGDRLARRFALISLARVAARAGSGEGAEKTLDEVQGMLLRKLSTGRSGLDSWSAMALGVLGRSLADERRVAGEEIARGLRASLASSRSADEAAACCLALGLLRDTASSEAVRAKLQRSRDDGVRAWAALALGLIEARDARDDLAEIAAESRDATGLFHHAAIALRLLGEREAASDLAAAARDSEDPARQATLLAGLGLIGDASQVELLVERLRDEEAPLEVRVAAATALGELCDTRPRMWSAPISMDLHYDLLSSTLVSYSGNGSGILEMR